MYPHEFGPQHGGPATNTANPTAADFFAQQHEDEEHHVVFEQTDIQPYIDRARQDVSHLAAQLDPGAIWQLPSDPMERIATALEAIAGGNRKADEPGRVVNSSQYRALAEQYRALAEQIQALTEEMADNESVRYDMADIIERIDEALGKSKAAPALAAKAVIEAWRNPQVDPVEVDHTVDWKQAAVANPDNLPGHTRAQTAEETPDFCQECSDEAREWVQWPCRPVVDGIGSTKAADAMFVPETAAGAQPEESTALTGPPANDAPVEAWREYARSQGFAGPEIDKANRSQIRTALGVVQPVTQPAEG